MDIDVLKWFVPFSELEDKYLEDALAHIEKQAFNKGDMLFKRGRNLDSRYYLMSGRVDLIDASFNSTSLEAGKNETNTALNADSPTKYSCIAKSLVTVFKISDEALDRITAWRDSAAYANTADEEIDFNATGEIEVGSISDDEATDWMSSLLQSPLFSRIPLTQVQELFVRFESVAAEKKDVVIKEGEKGDFFYVLASGRARVTNHSQSVDKILEPGAYFGEEALLGDTPRNATITMTENGELKRLDSENFEALLKAPVLTYIKEDELEKLGSQYKLLDVKMPMEYRINHIAGSINIPLARLRTRLGELAKSSVYVVPDDAGSRADIAAHLLCQAGFDAYILQSKKEEELSD